MDLAYVCEWERWPKSTHCPSVPLACAWSCRNLIAFTTDLRNDDQDLTRMIHILDTEHPWDVHSVSSEHSEAITCLEWDQSGEDGPGAGGPEWLRETVVLILDRKSQSIRVSGSVSW